MKDWIFLLLILLIILYFITKENNVILKSFKTNIPPPNETYDEYIAANNNNVDVSMTSFAALDGRYGNPRVDDPIRVEYSKNWDYDKRGKNTADYIHENTLWFNNQTLGDKWQFNPEAEEYTIKPPFDAGDYELINAGLTQYEFAQKKVPDSEMPV